MSRKLREALAERDAAVRRANRLSAELLAKTKWMLDQPTLVDVVHYAARVERLEALLAAHGIDPSERWPLDLDGGHDRPLEPAPAAGSRVEGVGAAVVVGGGAHPTTCEAGPS